MMKQYYYIIAITSIILSMISCKTDTEFLGAEGNLKLSIGVSDKVEVVSRTLSGEDQRIY